MTYLPALSRVLTVADTPFTVVAGTLTQVQTYPVNAAGGAVAVTLPDPTTVALGVRLQIGKTDTSANAVTLTTPAGVIGVGGQSTYAMVAPGTWLTLQSDGTNWQIV